MDHVVVDVEIQKTIEETPGGWDATHLLGVSCAVVYEYQTDRFRVFGPSDGDILRLKERLMQADRITGFNTFRFDFPVIWRISRAAWDERSQFPAEGDLEWINNVWASMVHRSNDLLRRIWQSLSLDPDVFSKAHAGWGLDVVCLGTLGRKKVGVGAEAPRWFQSGQWARLINYCVDDVALERDLSDFIDRYGYVVNGNTGEQLRITT